MSFVAARTPAVRQQVAAMQARPMSTSPYGRSHVWRKRPRKLPNPCVPQFPQQVIRADGSTFTHYTTSPRSVMSLTRDSTNNPMWTPFIGNKEDAESAALAGRLGRFNKKFTGLGGVGEGVEWMDDGTEGSQTKKKST
ncbi:hypothetical protein BDW22DRAFT_1358867 [Trametopsis cervina]|nr:hypothetical protein BDW22DRAFT_1358867 [Trametopsis cervina]